MARTQIQGIIWSAVERFSAQGVQFILSIIIARLVSPSDYGLIAMLTIFLSIAQSLVDSGFSNALIQKIDRTETDFSTVFYFNIIASIFIYCIFFLISPFIASFYNQPQLTLISRIVGLNFIISSLCIIQKTLLTINLNFKLQAKITLTSVIVGGLLGIYLAYNQYGVWALVFQTLLSNSISTLLFWLYIKWKPQFIFSFASFKVLFSFGSKILLTGLLATIYNNLYSLVIGKIFNAQSLGYYNRMNTIASFPSSNITNIIARAVYPIQCQIQNDNNILKNKFYQLLKLSSYLIFPLMLGLAALAEPLIQVLLSDKWIEASSILKLLCFALMWNHIMFLNWQLLAVKGRSDLSLKSEVIKKIISIIILIISIPFGLKAMCIGLILYSFIDITIIIYFLRPLIGITYKEELGLLIPSLMLSISMYLIVSLKIQFFESNLIKLIIGFIIGVLSYIFISYITNTKELTVILNKVHNGK